MRPFGDSTRRIEFAGFTRGYKLKFSLSDKEKDRPAKKMRAVPRKERYSSNLSGERCHAITRSKKRCSEKATMGIFCPVHYPKTPPGIIQRLWGQDMILPWEILDNEIIKRSNFG